MEYTEEQKEALNNYEVLRNRLYDAMLMVKILELDTFENLGIDIEQLKLETKNTRQHCRDLGVNVV